MLHTSLRIRVILNCNVSLLSDLRIGSGEELVPVGHPSPLMKDARGLPIIPGSTLKGFFRSYLERILLGLKESNATLRGLDLTKLTDYVRPLEQVSVEERKDMVSGLDAISKLFGVSGFASVIRFSDANVRKDIDKNEIIGKYLESRVHVSIDRNIDARKGAALVIHEVVKGPLEDFMQFSVYFDELSDPTMREPNLLFYYLVKMLNDGIEDSVGGWKSRGYGRVKIKLSSIEVMELSNLIEGRGQTRIADLKEFVNEGIKRYEQG
jgi:CRISPR-associated protein Csm3